MKQHLYLTLILGAALLFGVSAVADQDRPKLDSADYIAEQRTARQNRAIQSQTTDSATRTESSEIETQYVIGQDSKGSAQESIRRRMDSL